MKRTRKILAVILAIITVLSLLTVSAAAENDGIEALTLNGFTEEKFSVSWWKSEINGKYYAFLPADTDLSKLTLTFEASDDVYVNGEKLVSGEKTDIFSKEGEYTLNCGSQKYSLTVMKSANIPAMYIETESGSLDYIHADKSNKEKGKITVIENGEVTLDTTLSSIKGRGNSTWQWAKKPYNIKFDEKTNLFGMGKAKKWSLLASYNDIALIRNKVVFDFAEQLGLMYSSKSKHVDLYINGEYKGNYLVCESVEVGSTRVDINDLDDANEDANSGIDIEECKQMGDIEGSVNSMKWVDIPNDPEDITGGYLIEMEIYSRYASELSGFITKGGQPVVVKSPEYASKAQTQYISNFYQEFEDAVFSETGYNSLGKHYSDYIDVDSAVKMYLLEEFVMDIDVGRASAYFYKDKGENTKLVASPVWDFDFSLGNGDERSGARSDNPEIWYGLVSHIRARESVSNQAVDSIFTGLLKHDEFFEKACEEWNNTFKPLMVEFQDDIAALVKEINASALMNSVLWARKENLDTVSKIQEYYDKRVKIVTDFISKRLVALDKGFAKDSARLYFDVNGGIGVHANYTIASVGEKVKIQDNDLTAYGLKNFISWNTEKDGSGTEYKTGDEIILEKGKTVLYAQWYEFDLVKFLSTFLAAMKTIIEWLVTFVSGIIGMFQ